MRAFPRSSSDKRNFTAKPLSGFSLAEMLIASALFSILFFGANHLFSVHREALAKSGAHLVLKQNSSNITAKIGRVLKDNKRIFFPTYGVSLIPSLDLAGVPGVLGDGSTVANRLLFLRARSPVDVPVGGGVFRRVNLYNFHFYYVGKSSAMVQGSIRQRELWEWESGKYADYRDLAILPPPELANAAAALVAKGVSFAVDPSEYFNVNKLYYSLAGGVVAAPGHIVGNEKLNDLTAAFAPAGAADCFISISPNTSSLQTEHRVPTLAFESGEAPSGFEIGFVTPGPGDVLVTLRVTMVARGAFRGLVSHAEQATFSVRNIY
jgi:prepilin-type N-terminal cleavage/methylation domain-containing protein